jgi:hypothetical protein
VTALQPTGTHISIVNIDVDGPPELTKSLEALAEQSARHNAEVIVVSRAGSNIAGVAGVAGLNGLENIVQLHTDGPLGIPAMRALGLRRARGELVAFTESRCLASSNWLDEIVRACSKDFAGIGGAIEPAKFKRLVDWAVFICEYHSAMLPLESLETRGLPGNNSVYWKSSLEALDPSLLDNYWESFFQGELQARGERLMQVPTIVVRKEKRFTFGYFMRQRFHFSRSFAGMRRARLSKGKRLIYLAGSPLIPGLMLWRIGREIFRKKRLRMHFLLSLPLLTAFLTSYAIGEFVGYLSGGGDSLLKVE